jgi:hypothetical protein
MLLPSTNIDRRFVELRMVIKFNVKFKNENELDLTARNKKSNGSDAI